MVTDLISPFRCSLKNATPTCMELEDLHIHCIHNATLSNMGPVELHMQYARKLDTNGIIDYNNIDIIYVHNEVINAT